MGITVAPAGSGGLSYAVPIDAVRGLITQILSYGRTTRPALGITMAPPQVGPTRQPITHRPICMRRTTCCMHADPKRYWSCWVWGRHSASNALSHAVAHHYTQHRSLSGWMWGRHGAHDTRHTFWHITTPTPTARPQVLERLGVEGVLVLEVPPGLPAHAAGLRPTHRGGWHGVGLGGAAAGMLRGVQHVGEPPRGMDTFLLASPPVAPSG